MPTPTRRNLCVGLKFTFPRNERAISVSSSHEAGGADGVWLRVTLGIRLSLTSRSQCALFSIPYLMPPKSFLRDAGSSARSPPAIHPARTYPRRKSTASAGWVRLGSRQFPSPARRGAARSGQNLFAAIRPCVPESLRPNAVQAFEASPRSSVLRSSYGGFGPEAPDRLHPGQDVSQPCRHPGTRTRDRVTYPITLFGSSGSTVASSRPRTMPRGKEKSLAPFGLRHNSRTDPSIGPINSPAFHGLNSG